MNNKQKKRLFCVMMPLMLLIIIVSSLCLFYFSKESEENRNYATSHKSEKEEYTADDEELVAMLNKTARKKQIKSTNTASDNEVEPQTEAITDCAVKLIDIYTETGNAVIFKCFDAAAESYEWEYYDLSAKNWVTAAPENVGLYEDELHRQVSGLKIEAATHELMVRCILHFSTKEDQVQEASLFILPDQIKEISVEDTIVEANTYLRAMELPVNVTYADGTTDIITGLYDIYFISTTEEKENSTSVSGNRVETTTLITTECDYLYVEQEEKSIPIRYHPETAKEIETECVITGKDMQAPVISDFSISPYEISNIDKAVTLTISISADDDITPYPELEYAFMFADEEPAEENWGRKSSFDVSVERNGTYTAYVRDQAGNVATMEKQIITVDNKAPIISSITLSYATESGWCKSNTIIVDAYDSGNMSYRYVSKAKETDSDWITYSEYEVEANGTWVIQVKDSAGNISEGEIVISNIDREAPVIKSISIKK